MERIRARHGGNEQAVQGLKVEMVVVVMRVRISQGSGDGVSFCDEHV